MLSFGQRLKTLRREANLSQAELADAIGVSVHSVSKWECDSNMPDASLLVPLSVVLGVTTDCLLGVGTNEKEDLEKLKKTIEDIHCDNYPLDEEGFLYTLYKVRKEFLKAYPLNYSVKTECTESLYWYLIDKLRKGDFSVSDEKFESLWNEGVKMAQSVRGKDTDPSRQSYVRCYLTYYYTLKKDWDSAKIYANELPKDGVTKLDAMIYIAGQKEDHQEFEKLTREKAKKCSLNNVFAQIAVAESVSMFGNARKAEALEVWDDAMKAVLEFERLFKWDWDWDGNVQIDLSHPLALKTEILINMCVDHLAIDEMDLALDCVEQITEIGIDLYGELLKNVPKGTDKYNNMLKFIKSYPLGCYCRLFNVDDNILTREERFKACKARLDALE